MGMSVSRQNDKTTEKHGIRDVIGELIIIHGNEPYLWEIKNKVKLLSQEQKNTSSCLQFY